MALPAPLLNRFTLYTNNSPIYCTPITIFFEVSRLSKISNQLVTEWTAVRCTSCMGVAKLIWYIHLFQIFKFLSTVKPQWNSLLCVRPGLSLNVCSCCVSLTTPNTYVVMTPLFPVLSSPGTPGSCQNVLSTFPELYNAISLTLPFTVGSIQLALRQHFLYHFLNSPPPNSSATIHPSAAVLLSVQEAFCKSP